MTSQAQGKALAAVLNRMGAMVTNDMLAFFAAAVANKSSSQILALFATALPPEADRTGILVPWTVDGAPEELASNFHQVACVMVGLASYGNVTEDPSVADLLFDASVRGKVVNADRARGVVADIPRAVQAHPAPIGSRLLYSNDWTGLGPRTFRALGERLPPAALWAGLSLTPDAIGIEMQGTATSKGRAQGFQVPGAGRVTRDTDLESARERAEAEFLGR